MSIPGYCTCDYPLREHGRDPLTGECLYACDSCGYCGPLPEEAPAGGRIASEPTPADRWPMFSQEVAA